MNWTKSFIRSPTSSLMGLSAAFLIWAVSSETQAQTLRVIDSFPTGHYVAEYATKYWMGEVERLSKKAVTFEYYPAEQLGKAKDMLSLVQTGVADVGYIAPSYISDKLPLSAVAELPWNFSASCAGTKAFWKLTRDGGELSVREFKPLGIRILFALMLPPNQLVLGKGRFEGIQSLEGLKIRTSGAAKELLLRKLKAVPIQVAAPELHEAMSRGTIDGMLIPLSSMPPYELDKLSKTGTFEENFGGFVITYGISEARWKSLSAPVQKAMIDAGEQTTERACRLVDGDNEKIKQQVKASGMNLISLSERDRKIVLDIAGSVGRDWAESLDKREKPGTIVLRAFEEALK
jgi:TRAP-type C4-dicarboxylate transport system substrate-binding protein